ncbi:MAG: hypothetical protein D6720_00765 [Gammaproteobacteria bacterium]|nr:MAG: hypothetical protein D6720_00765 [Gammaproteobacteria bacterium]
MGQTADMVSPSRAEQPDLDWSQVRETVRMLNLAVAQIAMAMQEGDDSIQSLTSAFATMVGEVDGIAEEAQRLQGSPEAVGPILARCARVQSNMQQSIVAFQFYDRLSQRIDHVKHALEQLGDLVGDTSRLYQPMEWRGLQDAIRNRYSMREEQEMFDALLDGASIEEALERVRQRLNDGDIDDIELF